MIILSYDPFGKNAMYYEAGTVLKTHPEVKYNDGVRRIFLYVNGELPEGAGEDERKLKKLLAYINESTADNATDDNTRRLDDIVRRIKAKKGIGINYMKSWEWEREIKDEGRAEGATLESIKLIQKKISKGKSLDVIADELESTIEEIRPIFDVIKEAPAGIDPMEVYKVISENRQV